MMKSQLTTLCYLEKDDSYLMLHRVSKKNDINHDKWIGVGGHFEHAESPEDCLKREVQEETGLTLNSFEFRGIVTFVSDDSEAEYMHLFPARCANVTKENSNGSKSTKSSRLNYGRATRFSSVF